MNYLTVTDYYYCHRHGVCGLVYAPISRSVAEERVWLLQNFFFGLSWLDSSEPKPSSAHTIGARMGPGKIQCLLFTIYFIYLHQPTLPPRLVPQLPQFFA